MSNNLSDPKKYIPISEAAKFLGVSMDTIRRWDKSGVLQSKRLDGKNRYFLIDDLKRNQSHRSLSISEVSKKFNISPTTIRRLEVRGIIKPLRNKAGERVFDTATIEAFTQSEYFQRKKHSTRKQKTLKQSAPVTEMGAKESPQTELSTKPDLDKDTRPFLANFMAVSTAIFILLVTVGLGNVFLFKTQNYEMLPLPIVLGEKITSSPLIPAFQTIEFEENTTILKKEVQIEEPNTPLEKYLSESLKMINEKKKNRDSLQTDSLRLVEVATGSATIGIRQKPNIFSNIIADAKNGEVFEFLSFDSGWAELRLHESTQSGFIPEESARVKEFEFLTPESGWNIGESTNSASEVNQQQRMTEND